MSRILITLLGLLLTVGYTASPAAAQHTQLPDRRNEVRERVLRDMREVEQEQRTAARSWADRRRLPLTRFQSTGRRVQLVGVQNLRPTYLTSMNEAAARATGTLALHPGQSLGLNLTGRGLDIGIWDGGVPLNTHQELSGRVVARDDGAPNDHATHVAGTLAASGVRPDARGMAYEARLRAYDWDDDVNEMTTEAERGVLVSNHSYGVITGWYYGDLENQGDQWYWLGDPTVSADEDYTFGYYDVEATQFDRAVFSNPYLLPVVAAGNDRADVGPRSGTYRALDNQGNWRTYSVTSEPRARDGGTDGYDTISGASLAKNVLTVGSIGLSGSSDARVSSFSSFGPTDDGRIKPDIVGYGERVLSSVAAGASSYAAYSGTSMATPNVTGSLTLLQQHYYNLTGSYLRAATLKGLAIHTAADLGTPGPDYQYGWGLLNAETAVQHLTTALPNALAVVEEELAPGTTFTQQLTVEKPGPLRITVSWTDYASTRLPIRGTRTLDNPTPHLRNDLDARLIDEATGQTYFPFVLDPSSPSLPATTGDNQVDPVEQVFLASASAGTYTLVISHKGELVSGMPQPFSLLVSGAQTAAQPVAVSHLEAGESVENVVLTWQTPFEREAGTFAVHRIPITILGSGVKTLGQSEPVGTLDASGDGEQTRSYSFEERHVPAGRYRYQIYFEGSHSTLLLSEIDVNVPAPESAAVLSNYPNPFTDRTSLLLDLPKTQPVTLEVYDVLGRLVAQVHDGTLPAGRHELVVEADHWAPGIYFARLATPEATRSRRMVLVR